MSTLKFSHMKGLLYDIALAPFEQAGLRSLRRELLRQAQGDVLEIGAGTGMNFPYYPKDTKIVAIEPDEGMINRGVKRAQASSVPIIVKIANAQDLPFPDASFDTVVGTLVFCTIPDPVKAVKEVTRVLRPGGHFLLIEHVRKESLLIGRFLDFMTPAWHVAAHGCHLNRRTAEWLDLSQFEVLEKREIWHGMGEFWALRKLS